MSHWKKGVLAGLAVTVMLAWSGAVLAQEEGGAAPGEQRGGRGRNMAQMRQRMMDRMKETMGASDEEWAAISPLIEKVSTLRAEAMGGGRMGGRQRVLEGAEATPMNVATQELTAILDDAAATPEQITAKLTAYRAAREKARQELAVAQEDLRKVLSVQQEARLVLAGILD
jgi:hypothetical protein